MPWQARRRMLARCSRWMDFWIRNLHLDYKSDFDAYMRCTSYTYIYTHTHIDAFVCNWCTPNPTFYMGQPHTHRETEGRQRSSFLMLLSFVLLLFYSWPCFNSQRLCLWRVILLLARGRERESGALARLALVLWQRLQQHCLSLILSLRLCVASHLMASHPARVCLHMAMDTHN